MGCDFSCFPKFLNEEKFFDSSNINSSTSFLQCAISGNMVEVGYRVIRGPDWKWGDQDGGDGHVGTVVEVGHTGNRLLPDKTVMVRWDNGRRTNYRVGLEDAFDLLVFDGAPSGVKHFNKRCDGCGRRGIKGIRWQCTQCDDYDLCTKCYMDNVHNLQHKFRRFLSNNSTGVLIHKRAKSRKSRAYGIFPGAKVVRGCDWIWGNQDGGQGSIGIVTETRGWQNESDASVASVSWHGNRSNVYRVGHRGKMDVKYVSPGKGPLYYKDHLPVAGQDVVNLALVQPPNLCPFNVGDKVIVCLSIDVLRQMQEGHGGWNPKMANLIGIVGVVHRITNTGDVRVQYKLMPTQSSSPQVSSTPSVSSATDSNRWTINPDALTKINEGNQVIVIDDYAKVKQMQSSEHGNWNEKMKECLGQKGVIAEVYADGDVRVEFSSQRQWTFNPACLVFNMTAGRTNSSSVTGELTVSPPVPLNEIVTDKQSTQASLEIVNMALHGNLSVIKKLLHTYANLVNSQCKNGRTALQVAAYKEHTEVVRFLLEKSALISLTDSEGDGALHYAILGGNDECVRLIQAQSTTEDVNLANKKKQTPLHIAVIKDNVEWAKLLLETGCDVNMQDNEGDTAAHCCVRNTDNADMMRLLLSQSNYDVNKQDERGFNILFKATMKNRVRASEVILEKFSELAMNARENGFTALHISVLNKHEAVTSVLAKKCPSLLHKVDESWQTPLYIAASEGSAFIVEILVKEGSRIDLLTTDNKSCVHAALEKYANPDTETEENDIGSSMDTETMVDTSDYTTLMTSLFPTTSDWKEILEVLSRFLTALSEHSVYLAIACFLVKSSMEQNSDDGFLLDAFQLVSHDKSALKALRIYHHRKPVYHQLSKLNMDAQPFLKKCSKHGESILPIAQSNLIDLPHGEGLRNSVEGDEELQKQECMSCGDEKATVVFKPCQHKIVCVECCVRMKKCIKCHEIISEKVDESGRDLSSLISMPSSLPSIQQQVEVIKLQKKVRELQESNQCIICMEQQRDTALKCGHRFCHDCADSLRRHCPICRKPITGTIRLY
uniref:E3 ubiquitin-protein ligase MIB2-like isoform X1 n=1 Tax=Styela clava TaxID=7725 RepID=UPI00193A8713|nr:E3 ubiquitin-protein ligase MIB2-like isoform X1 [Styela clava]